MEGKIAAIKRIVDKIEPLEFFLGFSFGFISAAVFVEWLAKN